MRPTRCARTTMSRRRTWAYDRFRAYRLEGPVAAVRVAGLCSPVRLPLGAQGLRRESRPCVRAAAVRARPADLARMARAPGLEVAHGRNHRQPDQEGPDGWGWTQWEGRLPLTVTGTLPGPGRVRRCTRCSRRASASARGAA